MTISIYGVAGVDGTSVLDLHEAQAHNFLRASDLPALGLMGAALSEQARSAIQKDCHWHTSAKTFSDSLRRHPALFAIWLSEHVMIGLGSDSGGAPALYPSIQRAMGGIPNLPTAEREMVWRAFRRALVTLGIEPLAQVSGSRFMVNEYIRQAGVPIHFVDDLAVKMLRHAKRIGLPDEDDHDALIAWQATLLSRLAPPFSKTARAAVERDAVAYYTRAFIRVHQNDGCSAGPDPLETAISKAFTADGVSTIKRASIAQLSYRDGELGIQLPASGTPKAYQLHCGSAVSTIRCEVEGGFRTLPPGLHSAVTLSDERGEQILSIPLWEDTKPNRMLVFNSDGRLRARAQLTQEDAVELAPGSYVALCRFTPAGREDAVVMQEQPVLVEVPLEIRPSQELTLFNGPASVIFVGHSRPNFELIGQVKGSLERHEFWYEDLKAKVDVPPEWLGGSNREYELRLTCADMRASVGVTVGDGGLTFADLSSALFGLRVKPGMRRVVLELARKGESRALQRQSFLYWFGLRSVSTGLSFKFFDPPDNLVRPALVGLNVSSTSMEPIQGAPRVVRLAFDLGAGRIRYFSWNRPGVFVEIQTTDREGNTNRTPKALGSLVTVSLTSTKSILVSASEPGVICLGEMRQLIDFTRFPTKALPASLLASRLGPGQRTLRYETASALADCNLLELSHPHTVTTVQTIRLANILDIKLAMQAEPQKVTVRATDITSGKHLSAEHDLLAGSWSDNGTGRMQVFGAPVTAAFQLQILLDITTLGEGVWVLEFGASLGGVWGTLQDAEEGQIGIALALGADGRELSTRQLDNLVEGLALPDVMGRVERLHTHYLKSWSRVCQDQHSWLGRYFGRLAARLEGSEGAYAPRLIKTIAQNVALEARPGHLPAFSVASALPAVFAQRRSYYENAADVDHPLAISLRAMGHLKRGMAGIFAKEIHEAVAVSCANLALILEKQARPLGFSLEAYKATLVAMPVEDAYRLEDESFLPRGRELLGPMHVAHAWRDLERRLAVDLCAQSPRKTAALSLAHRFARTHLALDARQPQSIQGHSPVLRLVDPDDGNLSASQQVFNTHMHNIATVVSSLGWHCRRDGRPQGANALKAFLGEVETVRIAQGIQTPLRGVLGYYLHIAPAMFAFYLLLWEFVATIEFDPIVQNG